jgi:hypothetical protein
MASRGWLCDSASLICLAVPERRRRQYANERGARRRLVRLELSSLHSQSIHLIRLRVKRGGLEPSNS